MSAFYLIDAANGLIMAFSEFFLERCENINANLCDKHQNSFCILCGSRGFLLFLFFPFYFWGRVFCSPGSPQSHCVAVLKRMNNLELLAVLPLPPRAGGKAGFLFSETLLPAVFNRFGRIVSAFELWLLWVAPCWGRGVTRFFWLESYGEIFGTKTFSLKCLSEWLRCIYKGVKLVLGGYSAIRGSGYYPAPFVLHTLPLEVPWGKLQFFPGLLEPGMVVLTGEATHFV